MAVAGRSYANVPVIIRGSLEDPDDFIAKVTLVVTSQPSRPQTNTVPATILRNTLQDPPALTTAAPVVVVPAGAPGWGMPLRPLISSAPFTAAAAPAAAAPLPLIVAAAVKLAAAQPPVILRSTLADPPALTTPAPLVVAQPARWPPAFLLISSAPFIPPPLPFSPGTLTTSIQPLGGPSCSIQPLGGPS